MDALRGCAWPYISLHWSIPSHWAPQKVASKILKNGGANRHPSRLCRACQGHLWQWEFENNWGLWIGIQGEGSQTRGIRSVHVRPHSDKFRGQRRPSRVVCLPSLNDRSFQWKYLRLVDLHPLRQGSLRNCQNWTRLILGSPSMCSRALRETWHLVARSSDFPWAGWHLGVQQFP